MFPNLGMFSSIILITPKKAIAEMVAVMIAREIVGGEEPKGVHLLTMGTFNRFLVLNQFCMDKIKY
jgi:hypothetical protein